MRRPKKQRVGATRIATFEELQAVTAGEATAGAPPVRVTRYLAVADDQPLVVVQAPNRAAAEAVVARMRAPAHAAAHPMIGVLPVSKAPAALRAGLAAVQAYDWHPAACPACLRVWRSPGWALDTCPACLGLAGVEGMAREEADSGRGA